MTQIEGVHLLLLDIWRMRPSLASFEATHIFGEANSAANWVDLYVGNHVGSVIWDSHSSIPMHFYDLLFSDYTGCINSKAVLIAGKEKKNFSINI